MILRLISLWFCIWGTVKLSIRFLIKKIFYRSHKTILIRLPGGNRTSTNFETMFRTNFCIHKIWQFFESVSKGKILLFLRQCINIFRKVNDFYKIHKTQINHMIFYLECNLQFPYFFLLPLIFSYFKQC
jgi:hypothetical protein